MENLACNNYTDCSKQIISVSGNMEIYFRITESLWTKIVDFYSRGFSTQMINDVTGTVKPQPCSAVYMPSDYIPSGRILDVVLIDTKHGFIKLQSKSPEAEFSTVKPYSRILISQSELMRVFGLGYGELCSICWTLLNRNIERLVFKTSSVQYSQEKNSLEITVPTSWRSVYSHQLISLSDYIIKDVLAYQGLVKHTRTVSANNKNHRLESQDPNSPNLTQLADMIPHLAIARMSQITLEKMISLISNNIVQDINKGHL